MLVDSHAHLNFEAFTDDFCLVLKRIKDKKMLVVNIGSQVSTSKQAVKIAQEYDNLFAAVGIHPIYLGGYELDSLESKVQNQDNQLSAEVMFEQIKILAEEDKVVAIGEIGLDYFRLSGDIEKIKSLQQEYFIKQLNLASDMDLPIVLHARGSQADPADAYCDILEILNSDKFINLQLSGVIHCFGSNLQIARQFISRGFYVGFTGIVTFKKKAEELQTVAKNLPLEKILIETDSPYLAPEPYRGQRNEPVYVERVAEKIAELKNLDIAQVIEVTGQNAIDLFRLTLDDTINC